MENIKSNYLIQFLFYYITERRKLELIIYSKRHQKKLKRSPYTKTMLRLKRPTMITCLHNYLNRVSFIMPAKR